MVEKTKIEIGPQAGPQTAFLSSPADIVFYGGAAGGGKSFALLLEPLRHWLNPKFGGVIFRRNTVQVRNEGGLWDESYNLYKQLGAHPSEGVLEWTFPSGARMKFAHLEHDKTVYNWQGSQIPFIGFDELTHFSESQFWYMLSRNRSTSGVPGYIRGTTNPDPDSWVRKMIDWWIDEEGYPINERSGIIRWFIRMDNDLIWADTPEELTAKHGTDQIPKSFTFIPSKVQDNKILMEKDPSYLSNLMALSKVERMRLLGGNWNIRPSAGSYFQSQYFEVIDVMPPSSLIKETVRYWDRAATVPSPENPDPDWTAGVKLHKMKDGSYIIEDVSRFRATPLVVEKNIQNIATQDGKFIKTVVEEDPGQAGVADALNYVTKVLAGFNVHKRKASGDKETRAKPASAQCEHGSVKILRGPWNHAFLTELENFPVGGHDDQVDAFTGAFNELNKQASILDAL